MTRSWFVRLALVAIVSVVGVMAGLFVAQTDAQADVAAQQVFSNTHVKGFLKVGTCSLTGTQQAGDLCVEDDFKIGGELEAVGDVTFNEDVSLAVAADDILTFGAGYATKFRIGTGSTPDVAFAADGLFVEGPTELDSTVRIDGAADLNSTADIAGDVSLHEDVTLGDAADDVITFLGYLAGASPLVFEGATADAFETTLAVTDPTADNTVTFPDHDVTVGEQYLSFYVHQELGDGSGYGCLIGACTGSASTSANADLTTFYPDDDAGAADISAAEDSADANSAAAADVAMFGSAAAEAIGDAIYIGDTNEFFGGYFTLSQVATWSGAGGEFQYCTADDTWAALTIVEDSTTVPTNDSLEQSGVVTWKRPSDWVACTGGTKNMTSAKYVRFVLTDATLTQVPIGSQIRLIRADAEEDLPRIVSPLTVTEVQTSCTTPPSGVATAIEVCNATDEVCVSASIADGNYTDRTAGLSLPFTAGEELAIAFPNDASGETHAAACNITLRGE